MLKTIDDVTVQLDVPKPATIGGQNMLLAALKEEEAGENSDWEQQIPRIIESLRSDDKLEMIKLLKSLRPMTDEQRKWRRARRSQYQTWNEDEQLANDIMGNHKYSRVPVWQSEEELTRNDQRLCNHVIENWNQVVMNPRQLTEQLMKEYLQDIISQWKWSGEAEQLMKQDLVKA
jgi:hypothetical protein